jgi:hypothetical protein
MVGERVCVRALSVKLLLWQTRCLGHFPGLFKNSFSKAPVKMAEQTDPKSDTEDVPEKPLSFFSADGVDVSESEPEEQEEKDSEDEREAARAQQKRLALPSLRDLAAPSNPAYLHRAAIYEVHELSSFDRRAAPEAPKPWLKSSKEKKEAVVRDANGEITEVRGVAEDIYRKRSAVSIASEVTAAAMSNSNSYKYVEKPGLGAAHAEGETQEPAFTLPDNDKKKNKKRDSETPMSFREREKRKRDLGQQASDKSYVEEEKRILRQSGAAFGLGFD